MRARSLCWALLLLLCNGLALAQEAPGTKQEAVALVGRALAHVREVGLEQALQDINAPDSTFRDRDLYVFVYDFNGTNLANAAPTATPGSNLKDYRSEDGKLVIQQMIEMSRTHGGGAFEYSWLNPQTGRPQQKISYFKRIPDTNAFLGVGYYKPE